ncbi:MAG: 2-hydroxychromene-2-carboxylate isomerase [Gammaproteobacteria bacterium]|nr:2-hydroxychromene-2-carboxylate isomerase [Gammaproteobacteria bacterium]
MMTVSVEFHFDFGSPNAYLSHLVIPAIETRTGVAFDYVPVLLGGVFKATGNASPAVTLQGIKNKREYGNIEMMRFLTRHSIGNFEFNPHFPVNTLQLMRGAVYAKKAGFLPRYVDEVYRHMWAEPKKMDDPEVVRSAFAESDLPVEELTTAMQDPEVKQTLIINTERSVEIGSFGSPTFFVNGEIFFGKDKLRDVEEEIMARLG